MQEGMEPGAQDNSIKVFEMSSGKKIHIWLEPCWEQLYHKWKLENSISSHFVFPEIKVLFSSGLFQNIWALFLSYKKELLMMFKEGNNVKPPLLDGRE